jgi:hypothetical protein
MFRSQVKEYDTAHGSPFDRGAADSWYSRPRDPHYKTPTGNTVLEVMMTEAQIQAYHAGYDHNEQYGGKKDYE